MQEGTGRETYYAMQNRIGAFRNGCFPDSGKFTTSDRLLEKVNPDGVFCPFYDDTVFFDLSNEDGRRLKKLQDLLYQHMGGMLAEPLYDLYFHMTLHNLSNGGPGAALHDEMECNRILTGEQMQKIDSEYWHATIRMAPGFLMNMVNQSIVLSLSADSREDYNLLMDLYDCFEFRPVSWNYTPHITLAYYKPGSYGEAVWKDGFRNVQKEAGELLQNGFTLRVSDLMYARFTDMNSYQFVYGQSALYPKIQDKFRGK